MVKAKSVGVRCFFLCVMCCLCYWRVNIDLLCLRELRVLCREKALSWLVTKLFSGLGIKVVHSGVFLYFVFKRISWKYWFMLSWFRSGNKMAYGKKLRTDYVLGINIFVWNNTLFLGKKTQTVKLIRVLVCFNLCFVYIFFVFQVKGRISLMCK